MKIEILSTQETVKRNGNRKSYTEACYSDIPKNSWNGEHNAEKSSRMIIVCENILLNLHRDNGTQIIKVAIKFKNFNI